MILQVHPDHSITLEDPNTFTAFEIQAGGIALADILAAFGADAKAGTKEGEHLWISIGRLHALGAECGATDWQSGCDGMIQYAATKGWVDKGDQFVRAHVER